MSAEALRQQLYTSYKNRAMMYWHIYQALKNEVGEQKAIEIIKRGIYNRGLEIGKPLKKFAPADLPGLKDAFWESTADGGRMFDPEVQRCDRSGLEIKMRRCPLKEAWQDAGLHDRDIARMCDMAAMVDIGKYEGAGFRFSIETWTPGRQGCCLLKIKPGK